MMPERVPMKREKKKTRPTLREIIDSSPYIQLHPGEAAAALVLILPAFLGLAVYGIVNALR